MSTPSFWRLSVSGVALALLLGGCGESVDPDEQTATPVSAEQEQAKDEPAQQPEPTPAPAVKDDPGGQLETVNDPEATENPGTEQDPEAGDDPCSCDLNGDGACDAENDLVLFNADWGRTDCNETGVVCDCDLNEDGQCNVLDYQVFIQDWPTCGGPQSACSCDLNGDAGCDVENDFELFKQDWGRTDCKEAGVVCECDLNEDGKCNILDYQVFIQDWPTCGGPESACSCDLNGDGVCDAENDLALFNQDFGRQDCNEVGVVCECDLNADGQCNILDYQAFIQDWGICGVE